MHYLRCPSRILAAVTANAVELRCRDCSKAQSTPDTSRVVRHCWAYVDGEWVQRPDKITLRREEPPLPRR